MTRRTLIGQRYQHRASDSHNLAGKGAAGLLAASAQVPGPKLTRYAFVGEVSLRGDLVATPGVLSVAIASRRAGLEGLVVPALRVRPVAGDLSKYGESLKEAPWRVADSGERRRPRRLSLHDQHELARKAPERGA